LGAVWREPVDWPDDVRHKGGMKLIQVLVWNMGNDALMQREKSKRKTRKEESTKAEHRDGLTCSSEEVFVMETEQRGQMTQNGAKVNQEIGRSFWKRESHLVFRRSLCMKRTYE